MLDIDKLSMEPARSVSDGVGASCAVPGGKSGASWCDGVDEDAPEEDGSTRDDAEKSAEAHGEPGAGEAHPETARQWASNAFEEEVAYRRRRDAERLEREVQIEQEAMAREYEDFLKS